MNNKTMHNFYVKSTGLQSAYDDGGLVPKQFSNQHREDNTLVVIQRFFADQSRIKNLEREAMIRDINPGNEFQIDLKEAEAVAEDGFGPDLHAPSKAVFDAFIEYGQTDLGAVALARLIAWDDRFINNGWRKPDGTITEDGFSAYGMGRWRPFRVASSGTASDTVTQSGALVLPDEFEEELYSTGDVAHPLAIIHHEIKAHVLPLKEARGLKPGRKMELICIRLESEMLDAIHKPKRRLNWGKDDGTTDHTLYEVTEQYYYGLVHRDKHHNLLQIDPESQTVIGPARIKT